MIYLRHITYNSIDIDHIYVLLCNSFTVEDILVYIYLYTFKYSTLK